MFPHSTKNPTLSALDKKIVPLVSLINKLNIATFYSCEGHRSAKIIQSPHPLIILSPEYTGNGALSFLKFCQMIGIHNNEKDNKHGEEKRDYLCWTFIPRADGTIIMRAQNPENFTLEVMHKGLITLVENLEMIQKWYLDKNS